MLKIETTKNFEGFTNYPKEGGYFHSANMHKSMYGIQPGWYTNNEMTTETATFANMNLTGWFTQAPSANENNTYNYALDAGGNINRAVYNSSTWTPFYSISTTYGNGMIADQKNRVLYADSRYLGMWDGTVAYTTGTVAITQNTTALVGTGTTWVAGHVGKRIFINDQWKTISTVNSTTSITLTSNYTGATVTASTYRIALGFTDQWKDFGAASTPDNLPKPSDTFEDWVFFGNGNKVAGLNTVSDTWNDNVFELPAGFVIKAIKSGKNGILISATFASRCVLVLWDGSSDRSSAPWLWLNQVIYALVPYNGNWLAVGGANLFLTNGYNIEIFANYPDVYEGRTGITCVSQGADLLGEYLVINTAPGGMNRKRSGLFILNLNTKQWEFAQYSGMESRNTTAGALFNNNYKVIYSYYSPSNLNTIGSVWNGRPTRAYYISPPMGSGETQKTSKAVFLSLGLDNKDTECTLPATTTVSVKIYNFKRPIWMYGQVATVAGDASTLITLTPSTSYNTISVGDEITFLEGATAGVPKHVVSVTADSPTAGKQTIVLDSALPAIAGADEMFNISPFQLASTATINTSGELRDLFFNIKKSVKGKKFLVKIVFDNMNFTPELQGVSLVYDDLGVL